LKLEHDEPLSIFALNYDLRRYVENLSPLGDLTELWLQDNGIETLVGGGLEALVNLRQLALAGNPLEHDRELDALVCLPALSHLSFADRFFWPAPLADSQGYRQLVIAHLEQVLVLDGLDILDEERHEVGRCRLTVSRHVLKALMVSALETRISYTAFNVCFQFQLAPLQRGGGPLLAIGTGVYRLH